MADSEFREALPYLEKHWRCQAVSGTAKILYTELTAQGLAIPPPFRAYPRPGLLALLLISTPRSCNGHISMLH